MLKYSAYDKLTSSCLHCLVHDSELNCMHAGPLAFKANLKWLDPVNACMHACMAMYINVAYLEATGLPIP